MTIICENCPDKSAVYEVHFENGDVENLCLACAVDCVTQDDRPIVGRKKLALAEMIQEDD